MNLETQRNQECIHVVIFSLEIPFSIFSKLKLSSDKSPSQARSSSLPHGAWKPSGGRSVISESSLFRLPAPLLLLLKLAFSKVSWKRKSVCNTHFFPSFCRTLSSLEHILKWLEYHYKYLCWSGISSSIYINVIEFIQSITTKQSGFATIGKQRIEAAKYSGAKACVIWWKKM